MDRDRRKGNSSLYNMSIRGKAVSSNANTFKPIRGRSTESSALLKGLTKELNPVDNAQPKQKKQVLRKKDAKADHATRDVKVNDLKSRYLARKYSLIWMHRVFGRTLPSVARKHHEGFAKRKVFIVWKDEWWSARKEWKLDIRAECHNRYRLWLKVWQAWKLYMKIEQNEKQRLARATSHYNNRLQKFAFDNWMKYIDATKAKKSLQLQVITSSSLVLQRSAFNFWLKRLAVRRQTAELESKALHQWAYNKLRKAWIQWRLQLQEQQSLHQRMCVLVWHRRVKFLGSCWNSWLVYVEYCKTKRRNQEVADEQCNLSILASYFMLWLRRHRRAQEIAHFHEKLAYKERIARLRRILVHWKHYISVQCYHRELQELSEAHYTRHLKIVALKGFRLIVELAKRKAAHSLSAERHWRNMLLTSSWHFWLKRCEHSEEIKMLPKSRIAYGHFREVTLTRFVIKWKHYIVWRRHRKEQYALADNHFNNKLLPKVMSAFRLYVEIRQYKTEITLAADHFRRENLLAMVFYCWWRNYVHQQDVRMMERMAILHREEIVKRSLLSVWRKKTRLVLDENSLQEMADNHNNFRILLKVLHNWKLFHQQSQHRKELKIKVGLYCRQKLLKLTWTSWSLYVERCRRKQQKWTLACDHHAILLTRKSFKCYMVYHDRQIVKKAKNTRAFIYYKQSALRRMCGHWKSFVSQQREIRSLKLQASLYLDGRLKAKMWNSWKYSTKHHVAQRVMQEEKARCFHQQLQHRWIARIFVSWKYRRDQIVVDRLKWQRSVQLCRQTVLRKCLSAWLNHYHLELHKKVLAQKSLWFHNNRLLSTYYSQWRLQLMKVLIRRQKNTLALWHWSQKLQKKVIKCWLDYTKYRKQRQGHYNEAMQFYRNTLLQIGVTEWIRVATWQATQRQERAMEKETRNVQSVMLCVRRCAKHWRQWAQSRSRQRPKQPTCTYQPHRDTYSSHNTVSIVKSDWIDLVKKINLPVSTKKTRPQPRKPNFLGHVEEVKIPSAIQSAVVDHSNVESVPRQHVLPMSYPTTQDEMFAFLPSSASETSVIAVNTEGDRQLLDKFMPHINPLPLKQPSFIPLPPSAFEAPLPPAAFEGKYVDSSEHLPTHELMSEHQDKCLSTELQPALQQEIFHIRKFLKKYHSIQEKLRVVEERIKQLNANNGSRTILHQLQKEQQSITSALELHKPLMLRMVARTNEILVNK